MSKGNQKAQKTQDLTKILKHFDNVKGVLEELADNTEQIMPLVSKLLRVVVDAVKMYKMAFKTGLKYAPKE